MNPWLDQCPNRGYGLTHMKDRDCEDGHRPGQCCECEGYPGSRVAEQPSSMVVMPDVDLQARLRSLGISNGTEDMHGMEDIRSYHDEDTPVEPKMVTGKGAQGKPSGPGRGDLTPRQKTRLLRVDDQERWLDAHPRP